VVAVLDALGIFNPATYTGRIPTGFTTLGTPSDWDLTSNGDFSVILRNRLADQINVYSVTITLGTASDSNTTMFSIPPGAEYPYPSTTSGLNIGQRTTGTTYSLQVEMVYNSGGLNHTETGTLTGTISA
jgi:hypothetical protein